MAIKPAIPFVLMTAYRIQIKLSYIEKVGGIIEIEFLVALLVVTMYYKFLKKILRIYKMAYRGAWGLVPEIVLHEMITRIYRIKINYVMIFIVRIFRCLSV